MYAIKLNRLKGMQLTQLEINLMNMYLIKQATMELVLKQQLHQTKFPIHLIRCLMIFVIQKVLHKNLVQMLLHLDKLQEIQVKILELIRQTLQSKGQMQQLMLLLKKQLLLQYNLQIKLQTSVKIQEMYSLVRKKDVKYFDLFL